MLAAFIGESQLRNLRLLMNQDSLCFDQDRSHQLILLSPRIFDHFKNGRLSFQGGLSATTKDLVRPHLVIRDAILIDLGRVLSESERFNSISSGRNFSFDNIGKQSFWSGLTSRCAALRSTLPICGCFGMAGSIGVYETDLRTVMQHEYTNYSGIYYKAVD